MPKDIQTDLTERARADFDVAVECAHQQYESYVRQGQLGTEDDRRKALRDAISHAVGLLKLRAMSAQSEREAAAAEARRAALEDSPILSKYHGARGFEVERFIADYLAYRARLASPAPQEEKMNEDQIKHMVQRFLSWPLPKDFAPDGGITAKRPNYALEVEWAPSGTNLLTATQAEAMVRHMLEGCP